MKMKDLSRSDYEDETGEKEKDSKQHTPKLHRASPNLVPHDQIDRNEVTKRLLKAGGAVSAEALTENLLRQRPEPTSGPRAYRASQRYFEKNEI